VNSIAKAVLQVSAVLWSCIFYANFVQIVGLAPPLTSVSGVVNDFLVAMPYLFLVLLFLKKPMNIVGLITGYLDKKRVFWRFSVYGFISFVCAVGPAILLLAAIPGMVAAGEDPLLTPYVSNGHWLSWFAITLVVFVVGRKDILKGVFAGAFVYGSHEAIWFFASAAQFSSSQYVGEPYQQAFFGVFRTIVTGYMPLASTVVIILLAYFLAWRVLPWKKEAIIIAIPAVWGALQLLFGLPNTMILGNPTSYFSNPWVNMAEELTWVLPCLAAMAPDDLRKIGSLFM